jgi:hypothetical protein
MLESERWTIVHVRELRTFPIPSSDVSRYHELSTQLHFQEATRSSLWLTSTT